VLDQGNSGDLLADAESEVLGSSTDIAQMETIVPVEVITETVIASDESRLL